MLKLLVCPNERPARGARNLALNSLISANKLKWALFSKEPDGNFPPLLVRFIADLSSLDFHPNLVLSPRTAFSFPVLFMVLRQPGGYSFYHFSHKSTIDRARQVSSGSMTILIITFEFSEHL